MNSKLPFWFLIGFIATFVLLGLLLKTFVMLPDGSALARVGLLRYYGIVFITSLEPRPLGPATGDSGALVIFLQHAGLSLVGGVIPMTFGWIVGRIRGTKRST